MFLLSNITNDLVENYIRELLPENSGILKELECYALKHKVPIVHKEVAALLQVLTKTKEAKSVLEVGTAIAYSSLLFSFAMGTDGYITTIERNEAMVEQAKQNIERAGRKDNIRVLQGDAEDILKFLEGSYDIIFLDGAKGQYLDFLEECIHLLKPGGLLISDNILFKGMIAADELIVRRKRTIVTRMRDYLEHICSHPLLQTSIIPIGDGLALSYKVQEATK